MYSVLNETWPDIRIEWRTPHGIHTARCDGTTQIPSSVCTVITPSDA
jgi:hypothetical protein